VTPLTTTNSDVKNAASSNQIFKKSTSQKFTLN